MPAPSQHRRSERLAAGTDPRCCPYPGLLLRRWQTQHQVTDTTAAHPGEEPEPQPQRAQRHSPTGCVHVGRYDGQAASSGLRSQPADRSGQQGESVIPLLLCWVCRTIYTSPTELARRSHLIGHGALSSAAGMRRSRGLPRPRLRRIVRFPGQAGPGSRWGYVGMVSDQLLIDSSAGSSGW